MIKNIIPQLRNNKNITQEELAIGVQVSRQTIISIENGKYYPSLLLAFKIANFFELSIEQVFYYE